MWRWKLIAWIMAIAADCRCSSELMMRIVCTSTSELTSCYGLREETTMTEFEMITTIMAGITALTSVSAVLPASTKPEERWRVNER